MWTPAFAVPSLRALVEAGHEVCGVFTQPDRPKNRGMKLLPTPVKEYAITQDIPVFQPATLKDGTALEQIRDLAPQLIAVAAYGRILPEDYTCFAFQLDNLTEMSRRFGYTVGDGILKDFSGLLQLMGDTDGTVGYNGAGKFLAFFDECSSRKAEVMIRILQSQVDEYNKLNPEYPILFTAAWATSSEEELYHVRDLVRCAQKKMALIAEEGGATLGISET